MSTETTDSSPTPKRHTPEKLRRPRRDKPPFPAQAERAAFAPTMMMPSGEAEHIPQMDHLCCRLRGENSGVRGLVASGTSQSHRPLGKEDTDVLLQPQDPLEPIDQPVNARGSPHDRGGDHSSRYESALLLLK
jgi:hypothetical protein